MFFDEYEKNMTLDECRKRFTEDELKKLQDFGQHIVVNEGKINFGNNRDELLTEKVSLYFRKWIDSEISHKTSREGYIVEVSILPQELEARKKFPEAFTISDAEGDVTASVEWESSSDQINVLGLYLTFLQGLGINLHFEKATADAGKLTRILFDEKNTAQLHVTHKKYSGALSPQKNKYAYIVDIDRQLQFVWDEDGTPRITTAAEAEAVENLKKKKVIPAKCVDTDLLATLAAAVKSAHRYNIGDRITVYLPNFAKALGVQFEKNVSDEPDEDEKSRSHYAFWDKIKQLENIGGVLVEQGKILRAFVFLGYDQKENTLTFASPYLYSLMDILQQNPVAIQPRSQWKYNTPSYDIKGLSYLIDAKIITARSKITSEIVKNIVAGLLQRGVKPDATLKSQKQFPNRKQITFTVSYRELIKNIPQLREYLEESEPRRRTRNLQNVIFGRKYDGIKNKTTIIEQYLRDYTDAFNYWTGLQIEVEPVSVKELDNKIIIKHFGTNGEWTERLHEPYPETPKTI